MSQHYDLNVNGVIVTVDLEDDYRVEGSFDPDAPSDLDYYGYRDTVFTIVRAKFPDIELTVDGEQAYDSLRDKIDYITLTLQDTLDKQYVGI